MQRFRCLISIRRCGLEQAGQFGLRYNANFEHGTVIGGAPTSGLTLAYLNTANGINISVKLLEQFGKTRVLSSPMLMAMNNQTALLKVVDNVVYFQIQSQISQGTTTAGNLQSITTTPQTVAVGFISIMTPQVNDNGVVTLTVRPTITRVEKCPRSQPCTCTGRGQPDSVQNLIPQITVREMESVLQLIEVAGLLFGGG